MIPTTWRKSSFSGQNGDCVEVAETDAMPGDDHITSTGETLGDLRRRSAAVLVRNSNAPDRGTISFSLNAMAAFVDAAKSGEYDDLG